MSRTLGPRVAMSQAEIDSFLRQKLAKPLAFGALCGRSMIAEDHTMARLPYLTQEQLPEDERGLFDEIQARFGRIHNIFRILAHRPVLLRRLLACGVALRHETRLDPVLRELAILTVGRLTNCTYEYAHHRAFAPRVGVRLEQLERLEAWETDPAFSEQERAVMRYAAEATQQVAVSAATFDKLREFLDPEQIVDLAVNVAFYNAMVRLIVPFEVDLESDAHESRYRFDVRSP